MGIAIQELLSQEYFKDFTFWRGQRDCTVRSRGSQLWRHRMHFTGQKGRNWYFHQGTLLQRNQIVLKKAFREGSIQKSAGMMIKRERYLEKIPEEILELFDQYEVPLISMPFSAPWMEVMSQINTCCAEPSHTQVADQYQSYDISDVEFFI